MVVLALFEVVWTDATGATHRVRLARQVRIGIPGAPDYHLRSTFSAALESGEDRFLVELDPSQVALEDHTIRFTLRSVALPEPAASAIAPGRTFSEPWAYANGALPVRYATPSGTFYGAEAATVSDRTEPGVSFIVGE